MKKKIGLGVLAVFIVLQFFGIDKTNPESDPSKDFLTNAANMSPEVGALIKTSCYDCHSHNTQYPWYSSLAPVSWWLKGHVDDARKELNFSTFSDYKTEKRNHKLEECAEVLRGKEMPMLPYMIVHWEAWINDEQRERLAAFFESQRNLSFIKEN